MHCTTTNPRQALREYQSIVADFAALYERLLQWQEHIKTLDLPVCGALPSRICYSLIRSVPVDSGFACQFAYQWCHGRRKRTEYVSSHCLLTVFSSLSGRSIYKGHATQFDEKQARSNKSAVATPIPRSLAIGVPNRSSEVRSSPSPRSLPLPLLFTDELIEGPPADLHTLQQLDSIRGQH